MTQHRANPFDIDSMIASEDDSKQRAYLIILNSINNSLQANTETTRDISTKLDAHLTNFERQTEANNELLNKGRGAWKVLAWVLGLAQLAGGWAWVDSRSGMKDITTAIVASQKADATHESRLTSIEANTRTNQP